MFNIKDNIEGLKIFKFNSVVLRDCEEADAPRMRNIGYVMSGYDIYHGNPAPTYDLVDPGFRALIFDAEYNGEMTPDYR